MDVSGAAADVMVKESMQITAESIKLLAAGSKNLVALLWAMTQDNKKLVGKTNMGRLLREGKELKVFRIKESDLPEFRAFAKKNLLFAAEKPSVKNRLDALRAASESMRQSSPARGPQKTAPKKTR